LANDVKNINNFNQDFAIFAKGIFWKTPFTQDIG